MRKSSTFKQFKHTPKKKAEQEAYIDVIKGFDETKKTETPDFSSTEKDKNESSESQTGRLTTSQPPYRSTKTKFQEFLSNHATNALIAILIGLGGWGAITLIQQGNQLAGMDKVQNRAVEDIKDLQDKYSSLNDKSVKTDTLIEEMRNDLTLLKSRLLQK